MTKLKKQLSLKILYQIGRFEDENEGQNYPANHIFGYGIIASVGSGFNAIFLLSIDAVSRIRRIRIPCISSV